MFDALDTIVAVATPLGHAGLGVVRISGPDASSIATKLTRLSRSLIARRTMLARVKLAGDSPAGRDTAPSPAIDQAIALCFPAPASYTGEDVVELLGHGSRDGRAANRGAAAAGQRATRSRELLLWTNQTVIIIFHAVSRA
jgi:tRNA modification GTPase